LEVSGMVTHVLTRRGLRSPYRDDHLPDGRPVLRKRVEPAQELRTPPGVAVDEAVLDNAERDGKAGIVIDRVGTGETLWAPIPRWQRGLKVRRGFGPQRGLLWGQLDAVDPKPLRQLELFESAPAV
jgi:hypothetical protein